MYKDRIAKWRLDKKNKQSDMLAILRKKTERDAVGKLSSFRVRGRHVTIEVVLHYFKRKKSVEDEDAYNAPTPSDVSCRTPSPGLASLCPKNDNLVTEMSSSSWKGSIAPEGNHYSSTEIFSRFNESNALVSPSAVSVFENEQIFRKTLEDMYNLMSDDTSIPRSPLAPQTLLVSERSFFTVKNYFDASFERGSWVTNEEGHCTVSGMSFEAYLAPFDFRNGCLSAVALLESGQFVQSRRLLARAFNNAEVSLRFEHPRTLDHLIDTIISLKRRQHVEIVKLLLRYIVDMSTTLWTKDHPWVHIGRLIWMLEDDCLHQALIKLWRCTTDSLTKGLGQFHYTSLQSNLSFIESVYSPRDAEGLFRTRLAQWEGKETNVLNRSIMKILVYLGNSLLLQQRYAEAEQLSLDAVSRAEKQHLSSPTSELVEILAYAQFSQNKYALAEYNLRRAIQIASKWNSAEFLMIDLMVRFEEWLRAWGRQEETDILRAEIDAVIGRDETDKELDGK